MEESNVTLDGHPVESILLDDNPELLELTPDLIEFATNTETSYYRVEVGALTLHYFVDSASTVKIDSSMYDELVFAEDNDDDMHCWVTFKNSNSYRDAFIGRCTLTNSSTDHCLISNSDISDTPLNDEVINSLKDSRIVGSWLSGVIISENSVVQNSGIINSVITTGGTGLDIEESTIFESTIHSGDAFKLVGTKLEGCLINAEGSLGLQDVSLTKVALNVPDIQVNNRFAFFTVAFPKTTLHFYETASGNYAYARDGVAWNAVVGDTDFNPRMLSMFVACDQYAPDAALEYAYDSAISRIKTLNVLEKKKHQGLRNVES